MTLQNRVTPWGAMIAVPDRGLFMGNRGCIHNDARLLTGRSWARKAWIICRTEFKGRRRELMAPGQYTELFFLDEATAFAAGHRPCGECRKHELNEFKRLWIEENRHLSPSGSLSIQALDAALHGQRLTPEGAPQVWQSLLGDLPNGAMVVTDGSDAAWLVLNEELLEWTPGGYRERRGRAVGERVSVLTPRSVVNVLRAGYRPVLHSSATAVFASP